MVHCSNNDDDGDGDPGLITGRPIPRDRSGQVGEVDEEVLLCGPAVELCSPSHSGRPAVIKELAKTAFMRFEHSGDKASLDQAVLLYGQALETHPPGHLERAALLGSLAGAVLTRFKWSGNLADLDKAMVLCEEALELCPSGHPGRSLSLDRLAGTVFVKFRQSGNGADLEKAVSLREEVLKLYPPDHPHRSASLRKLANVVLVRFEQSGDRADLEQAVLLHEQTLELCPLGHPNRAASLDGLAGAVLMRFKESEDRVDLDRAMLLYEQALELRPPDHPHRSASLNKLANVISMRFEQLGERADLDRAVLLHEQALEICPLGHPNRAALLDGLTGVVLTRYKRSGDGVELDRAIFLCGQALELCPPGHPGRSALLNKLAHAVLMRYKQSGNLVDMDRVVLLYEQILELCPPGHPHRSSSLNNLAGVILTRFEQSGESTDLDRGVWLCAQALELCPPDHPGRLPLLNNLANAVTLRFEQTGNHNDLDQALYWCHNGITHAKQHQSALILALGRVYTAKYRSSHEPSDLEQALEALSQGAHSQSAHLSFRFTAAARWLTTAIEFSQWQSALTACRVCVTLLPELLWLELDLPSRLAALKRAGSLVCDGAACAIREKKVTDAVELLEGGRGLFWTHTLQLRTPLAHLPPSFEQKLAALSFALRAAMFQDSPDKSLSPHKLAAENVRRRQLVNEWSKTVKAVRETPGFERFLLPKPFKELAAASQHGPVIILNASRLLGCDALVIKSQHSPPEHVALPNMTFTKLERFRTELAKVSHRESRYPELAADNTIVDFRLILEELWMSVAKPIVDFLGLQKSNDPGRLWWCPTSLFAFMPIHAAGIYHHDESTCMSEYAVSSYTPTLDTLIMARSRPTPTQASKVLVITQPNTPGLMPLPCALEELERIRRSVPPAALLQDSDSSQSTKDGSGTTVENVLSRLSEASIVHFACHGTQNKDPLKSALHLQDGQLTLDNIIHRDLPSASIAFLSACHSATGDHEQPDEAIHLGAAMLAAGYQSVIATMWSMEDQDGPLMAEEVYKRLFNPQPDPSYVAHALHAAVRKLRETGAGFASWASYIHLGV